MRRILALLLACTLSIAALPLWAQGLPDLQAARAASDQAMRHLLNDEIDSAFAQLRAVWWLEAKHVDEQLSYLKADRRTERRTYGKSLGFEYVDQRAIGGSIVRFTYIERQERRPVVWDFFFYKPAEGWMFWRFSNRAGVREIFYRGD